MWSSTKTYLSPAHLRSPLANRRAGRVNFTMGEPLQKL